MQMGEVLVAGFPERQKRCAAFQTELWGLCLWKGPQPVSARATSAGPSGQRVTLTLFPTRAAAAAGSPTLASNGVDLRDFMWEVV